MSKLGVIECFFGPPWTELSRASYAKFLGRSGFGLYIYAPKADPNLRKNWQEPWSRSYLDQMKSRAKLFQEQGVKFGVGLSPYGLLDQLNAESFALLEAKLAELQEVGIDQLSILFDDMPSQVGLAQKQIQVMERVRHASALPLAFCPTFYSFDPVLDRVFGTRPENFLEDIGKGIPENVEIMWTGPKVISSEITLEHLEEVAHLLQRPPFLCDNLFANDGPKNCKFLRLATPIPRSLHQLEKSSHWCFNPMNQAELSKSLLLASAELMTLPAQSGKSDGSDGAFARACGQLYSVELSSFIQTHRARFLSEGLEKFGPSTREKWVDELKRGKTRSEPAAAELLDWLEGRYSVGAECLTD